MKNKPTSYIVKAISNNELKITGKANHSLWKKATLLSDFSSPWKKEEPTKTTFKALWDEHHLFFCFHVEDTSIHINKTTDTNESINVSDRVELFFRTDENLNPYYCLEIDPTPRIMDFKAYPNKNFEFHWNWPKRDININSNITKFGFTVEGAISLASLRKFNLIRENNTIETGIFRAKYFKQKDLTFEPTWITWVNPKTETPNFHIASSFGLLHLVE